MTKSIHSKTATAAAAPTKASARPKAIKTKAKPNDRARTATVAARSGKATHSSGRQTKLASLIARLRGKRGAGIDELVKLTGWQKHSVRGAISGALKKKLRLKVVSEKTDAGRTYRIVG